MGEEFNGLRGQIVELKAEVATLRIEAKQLETVTPFFQYIKYFGVGSLIVTVLFFAGVNYEVVKSHTSSIAEISDKQHDVRERLSALEAQYYELRKALNHADQSNERFLPRTRVGQ